jgi:hypothetical protein
LTSSSTGPVIIYAQMTDLPNTEFLQASLTDRGQVPGTANHVRGEG